MFRPVRPIMIAALMVASTQSALADDQVHILGWLEHANVTSVDIRMDAKLDTGAKTSAIHAEILSREALNDEEAGELRRESDDDEEILDEEDAEAGANEVVVFRISNEDGEDRILEREIIRTVSIKKRGGGVEKRPVVELELCLAGIEVEGEVSLADRTTFNYPLLIGRDMLEQGHIAVNPDNDYTASAKC